MSTKKYSVTEKNRDFIERLIEACGTSEPTRLQRLLNVSYQAAKNYLSGRVPATTVLLTIAEKTPYSIHWLLTGKGEKFTAVEIPPNTPLPVRQIRDLIRQECVEVVNEMLSGQNTTQQKVVVLPSNKVRSENVEEPSTVSEKRS